MSTSDALLHQVALSLRKHIFSQWHSELYDASGELTQSGYVVPTLATTLTYTDRKKVSRIFGPAVIQVGRFQDDPLMQAGLMEIPSSYIEIRGNDPANPGQWLHTLTSPMEGNVSNAGVRPMWTYEIGGGTMWWRRMVVDCVLFTVDSDQSQTENHRLGTAALAFLESLCTSRGQNRCAWAWPLLNEEGKAICDPFGETALQSIVVKSEGRQSGGPEDGGGDYIWKARLWLQIQTQKGV